MKFEDKDKGKLADTDIHVDDAPAPVGLYPHAKRVGNFLFLSGIGPRKKGQTSIPGVELDSSGNVLSYDLEMQCKSVFENIKVILESSGSSWDSIIDVTTFLTDMDRDFETYNRVYAEYFQNNRPTRTTVGISKLPTTIHIELKIIATIE